MLPVNHQSYPIHGRYDADSCKLQDVDGYVPRDLTAAAHGVDRQNQERLTTLLLLWVLSMLVFVDNEATALTPWFELR